MSPPSSLQPPPASSAPIELECVQRLFADPRRISESQFLRREVAQRMHERLALVKIVPQCVIDAGCGEGADLSVLQNRFPAAHILGIDASPAMLSEARDRHNGARSSMHCALDKWLAPMFKGGHNPSPMLAAANFAQLPLAVNTADLVWSNLALHWHPQPDYVFAEWRRVLRVDGLLMFSCFGPDTFKELRAACMHMDTTPHTLPFVDMHDFGDMLVNAGFSTPVMDMEAITVTYGTVEKLLKDVRAWGGNPLASRRRGLVGKGAWRRMVQALEAQRLPNGSINLSFEIIYGHAFRPSPRTTAAGEAIVRFDLRKK